MSDPDALDERLRAVERALTESDDDLTALRDAAELTRELETLSARLDEVEDRLDELDAATQALRGYVGNVRAVNQSVERRADAALAKVEALEADRRGFEADESTGNRSEKGTSEDRATGSGRTLPCGCRARRRRTENTADRCDSATETDRRDRGLLARIAEAL